MTDYVVSGGGPPERVAAIVSGVARGCAQAGCALLGGETAEHPGHFGPDDFDLAGAATGVVEADAILGPERVQPGDTVLALASSGLHSNGYSLVREILRQAGLDLGQDVPGARPFPRGRAAGAVPDLRAGLPGPGGRVRRARLRARHRRRAGGEPGPGDARPTSTRSGPGDLDAARDLRRAGRGRAGRARGDGTDVQHGGRHDRRGRPGCHQRRPGPAGRARACPPGCWARCPGPAKPA